MRDNVYQISTYHMAGTQVIYFMNMLEDSQVAEILFYTFSSFPQNLRKNPSVQVTPCTEEHLRIRL